MSRRSSNSQSNTTLPINRLDERTKLYLQKLSMSDQFTELIELKKRAIEANDSRLDHLLNNKEKLESLKMNEPNNTHEINRIGKVINRLNAQESDKKNRIDKLTLILDESRVIIKQLLDSSRGQAVLHMPPTPRGRGKKRGTKKRKKPKKRKTRIKK
tara:strand:- start:249 stop:719 length:471 start_codon:yes stop_codon:yes gene_type:complete